MPGFLEVSDRYTAFAQRQENEADFNADAELELLRTDLQRIFDAANARGN